MPLKLSWTFRFLILMLLCGTITIYWATEVIWWIWFFLTIVYGIMVCVSYREFLAERQEIEEAVKKLYEGKEQP